MHRGRLSCSSLLLGLLPACAAPPPAAQPTRVEAVPVTLPSAPPPAPAAAAAPPDPDAPLRVDRAGQPAPWLEPSVEPLPLWEESPRVGITVRMRNPILGDTHAIAIEPGAIVLGTRAGALVITRGGVRGLVPAGIRFVGVLDSGEVFAEDQARAPLRAASADGLVTGLLAPVAGVERVFDAAGRTVVGLRGGALMRSEDGGASFKAIDVGGAVDQAFVRADGVVLAGLAGAAPAARWRTVDKRGKVTEIRRELSAPLRWGGYILAGLERNAMDEARSAEVLLRDGRRFARLPLPDAIKGAEYINFHPIFLGAPTVGTRAWEGDAIVAAPERPPAAPKGSSRFKIVGSEDDEPAGVIGFLPGAAGPAPPRCRGLRCIAELRPMLPRQVGSSVVARFFDDGLCEGPPAGKCKPGPLLRAPTIGIFDRRTGALSFRVTPPSCEPVKLENLRGLVILECEGDRYVANASGSFVNEGPARSAAGSWEYEMADDGTLLAVRWHEGRFVDAEVRMPVAPTGRAAFRDVSKPDAVSYRVLPGGAVLVARSNAEGDRLGLTLDAPEGVSELAAGIPIERPVRAIVVEGGEIGIVFADGAGPRRAGVTRAGRIVGGTGESR